MTETMKERVERMKEHAKLVYKHEDSYAPMIEFYLPGGKIVPMILEQIGGDQREKAMANVFMRAFAQAFKAEAISITAEAWSWIGDVKKNQSVEEIKATQDRIEVIHISVLNREGAYMQWVAHLERDEDGHVIDFKNEEYRSNIESGGEASGRFMHLFDGDVPDEIVERVKKEWAESAA